MHRIIATIIVLLAVVLLGRLPVTLRSAPLAITTTPTKPRLNLPMVADGRPSATPTIRPSATAATSMTPGPSVTPTSTPRPNAVVIDDVIVDPTYDNEYVVIRNADTIGYNIAGWRLINATRGLAYTFPSFVLEPDYVLAVYSQVGNDDLEVGDFYWDQPGSVWNIGDRAELRDAQSRLIHSFTVPEQ